MIVARSTSLLAFITAAIADKMMPDLTANKAEKAMTDERELSRSAEVSFVGYAEFGRGWAVIVDGAEGEADDGFDELER